jgi:hypothetical protein
MLPCYDAAMTGENDNLFNFIATTVETLRQRIDVMSEQMATKVDIANLRDEMATKADLAALEARMASKADLGILNEDLGTFKAEMAMEFASVRSEMATKNDLRRLETTMHGEFEQVHIRLDSLDGRVDNRMGQIETDVSRLRSVVYLLVKDKPDMLRLLGRPTAGENQT